MLEQDNNIVNVRTGRNVFGMSPKISVVIPAYNSAETIRETLDSVLAQKFRELEIIVVNDGSPDTEALEVAISARLDDIIYIKQENAGAGVARNTAIEHARGEMIAFLDADDVWLPDFLASQYIYLQRHGCDMVYCDALLFGMRSAYRHTFMETAPSEGVADFNSILDFRCNVITSGTMARKQVIVDAGMFEIERVRAHDFLLWLRMAENGAKIGYQRKVLLKYRVSTTGLSGDAISRVEREIDALERVRHDFELDETQQEIVRTRLAGLEADLAVEQGKAFLRDGNYPEAALAFRVANRHRKSLKLTAVAFLARTAPQTLLKFYRSHRPAEIG